MKKFFIILILMCLIPGCVNEVKTDIPNNKQFEYIAEEPPFGVSKITINNRSFIIVRSKAGYGEGLAIIQITNN